MLPVWNTRIVDRSLWDVWVSVPWVNSRHLKHSEAWEDHISVTHTSHSRHWSNLAKYWFKTARAIQTQQRESEIASIWVGSLRYVLILQNPNVSQLIGQIICRFRVISFSLTSFSMFAHLRWWCLPTVCCMLGCHLPVCHINRITSKFGFSQRCWSCFMLT